MSHNELNFNVCMCLFVFRHAQSGENAERGSLLRAATDPQALEEDPHHGGRHLQVKEHTTTLAHTRLVTLTDACHR